MNHPVVKVISDSGCHSWILGCPKTGAAILVDPRVGRRATYEKTFAAFGLHPVAVVDTHTHADHLSDSVAFARQGVPVFMSERTTCRRPVRRLADGDTVRAGRLTFVAREAPGHTDDSIVLVGHGVAVAGDTLFAGGLARADFRGSDPARLFDSVQRVLMTLPDETVVLPGHGYRDVLFTTVGVERRTNPALQHASGAAYARHLDAVEGAGNTPDVDRMLEMNLEAEPDLPASGTTVAACCSADGGPALSRERELTAEDLADQAAALAAAGAWIDVRDRHEFTAGHVPGTRNVPLGELGFHLGELRGREPLVLSCQGGVRSMTAARTLHYLGVVEAPVSMAGGYQAWQTRGLPVEV